MEKSNLDKVVKRQTYEKTPLGLEDPCVIHAIVLSLLSASIFKNRLSSLQGKKDTEH